MRSHAATRAAVASGVLLVFVLTGCITAPDPIEAASTPTPPPASRATTQQPDTDSTGPDSNGSASTTPPGVPGAGAAHDEPVDPDAVVDLEPAVGELAAAAAVTFMRAFGRPELTEQQWWAGLERLLTPAGAQAYAYVDPTQVPFDQTEPGAVLQPDSTPVLAHVVVTTNAGDYIVTLERAGDSTWLVDRITPLS